MAQQWPCKACRHTACRLAAPTHAQPIFVFIRSDILGCQVYPTGYITLATMISRIANLVTAWDGLWLILTVIAGVGLLGYVGVAWLIHFVSEGRYLFTAVVSVLLLVSVSAALLRIPAAQIAVLGGAIICGAAFLMGFGNALLP